MNPCSRADVGTTYVDALDLLRALKWVFHYAPNKREPDGIAAVLKRPSRGTTHAFAYDVIMIFDEDVAYGYRTLEHPSGDPFVPTNVAYRCAGTTVEVCGEILAVSHPQHEDAPRVTYLPTEREEALASKFRGPKEVRYS